jgi:general stress protein YciG
MAPKSKGSGSKGFASMNDETKKDIASRGGRASAQGDTSNRGFASMDKDKQREISSQGGRASKSSRPGRNEEDAELNGIASESDASERDLNSLEDEDSLESSKKTHDLAASETDEDEDEGLGDGNLGRSTRDGGLSK